jgi:hypothetical protein
MTITDKTLKGWKEWLSYIIANTEDTPLAGLQIRIRDTEEMITYPSMVIREASVTRHEAGGIVDSNVFNIMVETCLESVIGYDAEDATSEQAHNTLRTALDSIVNNCNAEAWLNSRNGLVCFRVYTSSPVTDGQDAKRTSTWSNQTIVCDD